MGDLVVLQLCVLSQELGWYNPMTKDTNLKAPEIRRWLDIGAQPSETVEALLKKAMVIDVPEGGEKPRPKKEGKKKKKSQS